MKKDDKLPKTKSVDPERETRVVLEAMHSDIKRIAENQTLTNDRLAVVEEKVIKLEPIVGTIKIAVTELGRDLKRLDTKVNSMDNRLTAVDTGQKTIEKKVDNIDSRLTVVENKLDTALDNHQKRIIKLEEKVFA